MAGLARSAGEVVIFLKNFAAPRTAYIMPCLISLDNRAFLSDQVAHQPPLRALPLRYKRRSDSHVILRTIDRTAKKLSPP